MSIHAKTMRDNEEAWCVILSLVRSEFVKNRVVEKLSQTFSISEEEAFQLVESAPVVLLEDLPFEVAQKVKFYFEESGLELHVTNNPLEKRKCFKTVWADQPRLNFLDGDLGLFGDGARRVESHKEILSREQAVAHIRGEAANQAVSDTGTDGSEERNETQKKYALLMQQHTLLCEEKAVQDQKTQALENESRFLKEKESSMTSHLKVMTQEKDTLLHELEALRTKCELLMKERETRAAPEMERVSQLEGENLALRERLQALREEYDEAEQVWVGKVKAKEEEWQNLKRDTESCQNQLKELSHKWEQEEKNYRSLFLEETLRSHERVLKSLVMRQQDLEKEITEKEKLLKGVLAEQERIEREIVRTTQVKDST